MHWPVRHPVDGLSSREVHWAPLQDKSPYHKYKNRSQMIICHPPPKATPHPKREGHTRPGVDIKLQSSRGSQRRDEPPLRFEDMYVFRVPLSHLLHIVAHRVRERWGEDSRPMHGHEDGGAFRNKVAEK